MIIRILSEGQYDVPDDAVDGLNSLDSDLEAAVEAKDHAAFGSALASLLDRIREVSRPVAVDALVTSDLVLPNSDASLDEVRDLLSHDGLIPG